MASDSLSISARILEEALAELAVCGPHPLLRLRLARSQVLYLRITQHCVVLSSHKGPFFQDG